MAITNPSKSLVVFCDGSWVGRETQVPGAPHSNIRLMAEMIGPIQFSAPEKEPTKVYPIYSPVPDVVGGYQEGIGVNKTFLEYVWDGATASTIGEECVSVYKFIVEHYTDDHEIWMFGLSRGAFTVRCVASMINNCGIIKTTGLGSFEILTLCQEIYKTYRSPLDVDHPTSPRCVRLRKNAARVWPVLRPVRFLGLYDTVGSLGIPRINAGIGFDWPEFYDQKVSSVVQDVYHAVSLHDRLWIFQPCLALPSSHSDASSSHEGAAIIHQKWFPGTHYDLGRQTFRFVRQAPLNQVERWLGALPDRLSKTIYPNQVLSDVVLRWILEAVQSTSSTAPPWLQDVKGKLRAINARLASPPPHYQGSGDIYGSALAYAPGGTLVALLHKLGGRVVDALNHLFPQLGENIQDLLGIKTILRILTATRDRRIPGYGHSEEVYDYKTREEAVVDGAGTVRGFRVEETAGMEGRGADGGERYPSRTVESWVVWKRVLGGSA